MVTPALLPVIRERVLLPTLHALRRRGIIYQGVLYAGLMIGPRGPQVLEFNPARREKCKRRLARDPGKFIDQFTRAVIKAQELPLRRHGVAATGSGG